MSKTRRFFFTEYQWNGERNATIDICFYRTSEFVHIGNKYEGEKTPNSVFVYIDYICGSKLCILMCFRHAHIHICAQMFMGAYIYILIYTCICISANIERSAFTCEGCK